MRNAILIFMVALMPALAQAQDSPKKMGKGIVKAMQNDDYTTVDHYFPDTLEVIINTEGISIETHYLKISEIFNMLTNINNADVAFDWNAYEGTNYYSVEMSANVIYYAFVDYEKNNTIDLLVITAPGD